MFEIRWKLVHDRSTKTWIEFCRNNAPRPCLRVLKGFQLPLKNASLREHTFLPFSLHCTANVMEKTTDSLHGAVEIALSLSTPSSTSLAKKVIEETLKSSLLEETFSYRGKYCVDSYRNIDTEKCSSSSIK